MKIVHTADWHVGRTLRGRNRGEEHRAVLAELVDLVERERADLVLVAGDVFDAAAPPPEAERLVYRTLLDLADTGAQVVVVAGNHDHPRRLDAVAPLLSLGRVTAAGAVAPPDRGGVVEVGTRSGETARIALLPFLSRRGVVRAEALLRDAADQHQAAYAERIARIVAALCQEASSGTVNLLVGHLLVTGGTLGGGERAAHTVFEYAVPAAVFPADLHYVALGHLHRPQRIPAGCPVWYSGSPLQLDFGETADEKAALVVDVGAARPAQVSQVSLQSGRRLRTLVGTPEELQAQAGHVDDAYLKVVVRSAPRAGLAADVRAWFPEAVDVVVDSPERDERDAAARDSRAGRSPSELFAAYLHDRGVEDPDVQRLFDELHDAVVSPDSGSD